MDIPLEQLRPHPHNSNVMPEAMLAKLARHIERTNRYPPLIVRPMPPEEFPGAQLYQLLDGHHRAAALRRLGHAAARCDVWEVDDREALLLLATLNRLEGGDDPRKRSILLQALRTDGDALAALSRLLPESAAQLEKLAALGDPPTVPRPPQSLEAMPQAVLFFLLPHDRRTLEAKLRDLGGPREAALMKLLVTSC